MIFPKARKMIDKSVKSGRAVSRLILEKMSDREIEALHCDRDCEVAELRKRFDGVRQSGANDDAVRLERQKLQDFISSTRLAQIGEAQFVVLKARAKAECPPLGRTLFKVSALMALACFFIRMPWLILAAVVCIFLGLGWWNLDRYNSKNGLDDAESALKDARMLYESLERDDAAWTNL
jgi:hypothetical protein